ncbi:MAG: SpoIIE family protein phosphatase [Planctomycetota bacterium]|nr:SpoIIE family protein phosphatase [Planctomycetota bacterium]
MRLNILWKLILTIALPLLGIYIVVNVFEFRSLRTQAIRDVNERVTRLATLYAQQFEGELQTFAQIAESAAEFLSIDPDLGRRDPWTILEKNIAQNRLVYGSALAWIPDAEHPEPASPFVFRSTDGGTRRIDIATEAYDYRTRDWFTLPIELGTGVWTEPYFDEGAGNILMSTFATPVRSAEGTVIAVMTVDLPLEPLQQAMQLDELNQGVFMIISREDRFISHPDPGMIMEVKLQDLIEQHGNRTGMRELYDRIRSENTGASGTPLLIGDVPYWIAFAPIPSTQWSLIAAFPSADVLAPVYNDLYRDVLSVGIGLLANLVAIFILALLFTRPIRRLSTAMAAVTHGDMDARVEGIESRDEFGDLARGFNEMSSNLRANIDDLASERAQRDVVEAELNMAREIQASLLPDDGAIPDRTGFELAAANVPARQVAGDFYDYWMCDDRTMAFVIADVSGKGVPAAFFMGITRTMIRNLDKLKLEPHVMMRNVNELLMESNRRSMFVTLFYGVYELDTGRLRYVNAGHLPPVHIPATDPIVTTADATGTVLGVIPEAEWTVGELMLGEGEALAFYTDGVTEARNRDGTMLETDGFIKLIARHREETSDALCRSIISFVDDFEGAERGDDVTVMVLRRLKVDSGSPEA